MVSQTPPARQANGRRRPDRRERPAGQQPRHLAQYPELTDNSPAAMKLIGIAMLTEINGDVKNRNLAFQLAQHEDFADSDLGEIWRSLKTLHGRGLPLTPDRVLLEVKAKVPNAAAILYEALSGADRPITTQDAEFYAEAVAGSPAIVVLRWRSTTHSVGCLRVETQFRCSTD